MDAREREKVELKAKLDELEDIKIKYEAEKDEKQKLQDKLDQVVLNQSDSERNLSKTSELLERVRLDNKKKTEQIEKYQRDISHMEDRMRNLEIRASEVEKAELILESTKSNLESTQHQVRTRDGEIRRIGDKYDDTCKQLESANNKIKELEEKIQDLKYQVRHELMKNENIEKNLETIPYLKEEIVDKEKELKEAQKQIEDKNALLQAARKASRDYKDKLREVERKIGESEKLHQELEIAQCEVNTLKRLMTGKDFLVLQKSKALDLAKDVIGSLNQSTDTHQMFHIQQLLDRIAGQSEHASSGTHSSQTHTVDLGSVSDSEYNKSRARSAPSRNRPYTAVHHMREIDVSRPPYSSGSDSTSSGRPRSGNVLLERVINDGCSEDSGRNRPRTAIVHPTVKRTPSYREPPRGGTYANDFSQKPSPRASSAQENKNNSRYNSEVKNTSQHPPPFKIVTQDRLSLSPYRQSKVESPRSSHPVVKRSRSEQSLSDSDSEDGEKNLTEEQQKALAKLSSKEKDQMLAKILAVGDRISIAVPQKPPRYGKRKPPKPRVFGGIAKFIGPLNKDNYDARLFIGVRLDETAGDTDGCYKGKRFMYTPSDQGKFFKLRDVTWVLDVKSGKYKSVSTLLAKQLSSQDGQAENGDS